MENSKNASAAPVHGRRYAICMMLAASVLFSTGGLLCKMIPWSALTISGVRSVIGLVVFGIYLKVTHHPLRFNRQVAIGALCLCGNTTLYVVANKLTTAANTIVLQYTTPIWIILLIALFFHKKPEKADIIAIIFVIAGIACFFFDSLSSGGIVGDLIAILSGLCFAGMYMQNSIQDSDTLSSMFFGMVINAVAFGWMIQRETVFVPATLTAVVALGLFQVGIAYIFFNEGTKYISPVSAALINGIEPVLNPILVAVFWGEMLTPLSLLGAAIVILSIVIYNIKKAA